MRSFALRDIFLDVSEILRHDEGFHVLLSGALERFFKVRQATVLLGQDAGKSTAAREQRRQADQEEDFFHFLS
ncbi:hypothetical protein [Janthinobacterium sp. PC23-8]|uniref:hypothetical protein n=1 Tax=Janthinobacterium sp. PC23-8 TaxID=2012679 RepID=UPI00114004C1|nr:hypothetical protein [Janthinobacterium sp. PC23-8]